MGFAENLPAPRKEISIQGRAHTRTLRLAISVSSSLHIIDNTLCSQHPSPPIGRCVNILRETVRTAPCVDARSGTKWHRCLSGSRGSKPVPDVRLSLFTCPIRIIRFVCWFVLFIVFTELEKDDVPGAAQVAKTYEQDTSGFRTC